MPPPQCVLSARRLNAYDWHIQTHTEHWVQSSSTPWMHFTRRYAQTCVVVVVATDHASTQQTYNRTLFTFSFEFYLSHSFCIALIHWSSPKLYEGLTFSDLIGLLRNRYVASGPRKLLHNGWKRCHSHVECFPENWGPNVGAYRCPLTIVSQYAIFHLVRLQIG